MSICKTLRSLLRRGSIATIRAMRFVTNWIYQKKEPARRFRAGRAGYTKKRKDVIAARIRKKECELYVCMMFVLLFLVLSMVFFMF